MKQNTTTMATKMMPSQGNYTGLLSQPAPLVNQLAKNNNVDYIGRKNDSLSGVDRSAPFGTKTQSYPQQNPNSSFEGNGGGYYNGNQQNSGFIHGGTSGSRRKTENSSSTRGSYSGLMEKRKGDPNDVTPISHLVGFSSGFTLKAKIIKKSTMRKYQKNGGEGQVFSIDIADSSAEIQGSFFGEAATENYEGLTEGRVYFFTGGTVKDANPRFQT